MFKKVALPVLVLLGYVSASDIQALKKHHPKHDSFIDKIKAEVERIAETQFISNVTVPQIEQSWEEFEKSLEQEIERRAQIAGAKLRNTLIRYKKLLQQANTYHQIRELAWEGTSIDLIHNRTVGCDMDCVSLCFSDFNYRFENIEQVDQYCLVASCNCQTGHTHYHAEAQNNGNNWDINNFGTDRDLYDKNGTQIYTYVGDHLYHRDLYKNGTWANTWHEETNQTHPLGYREKENYFEELNKFNYLAAPSLFYNIETECDLECSEECMSLRDHYPLEMIDNCNANRCGCYFSTVDDNTCNHDCKASCLFTPGGRFEIQQCLTDLCDCNIGQKDIPINDRHDDWRHFAHLNHTNSSHHNGTEHQNHTGHHNATNSTQNATDKHHSWKDNHKRWRDHDNNHNGWKRHNRDMLSHHANHTNSTNSTTNLTKSVISMMGFVGYESYLTNGNSEVVPETDLPLISISITFAVFMVLVLTVYLILLRKEIQNEKKQPVLGYEDKNIYSEKLHFLENQEVHVSTL